MLKELYEKYVIKYYKIVIVIISVLFSIFYIMFSIYQNEVTAKTKVEPKELVIKEVKEEKEVINYYYVDIKGAVTNPGVYQLDENARVIDVIKMAGNLLDNADTSVINLGKKINDEMVIIIYTKDEISKFKEGNKVVEITKIIEKECICPDIINDACINENKNIEETNDENIDITSDGKVSINRAGINDLMTLVGIGESKAKAIIDYRNTNGPFNKIEDIMNVSGIGESSFAKIKDFITL